MRRLVLTVTLALAAFAAPLATGEDSIPTVRVPSPPEPVAIGGVLPPGLRVTPFALGAEASAETVPLASFGGDAEKPLVVLFWSARCPVCRRYGSVLKSLAKDYEGRARVAVVFPNGAETEADVGAWLDATGPSGALALDPKRDAAGALGATVTPTALVFDAAGTLKYRGPIDDDRRARRRDTTDHLRVALESVLAGKPVENPEPRAFGSSVRGRPADRR
jgi:thiol-disulfide isomerase/thioredoxin